MKKLLCLSLLTLWVSGCATHQLKFQPWKGIPSADLKDVQAGLFSVPKDKLFDAAAATLEHEPYLHWTFDTLDKSNGLIVGSAGLFREIQVRVTDGPASVSGQAQSKMAVSIPRRELKSQAKIYILNSDKSHKTAYEPSAADLPNYSVEAADTVLDRDYFYSFTYHVLTDRVQVPFSLESYEEANTTGLAPAQESAPSPVVTAPLVKDEAPVIDEAKPKKAVTPTSDPQTPPAHRE